MAIIASVRYRRHLAAARSGGGRMFPDQSAVECKKRNRLIDFAAVDVMIFNLLAQGEEDDDRPDDAAQSSPRIAQDSDKLDREHGQAMVHAINAQNRILFAGAGGNSGTARRSKDHSAQVARSI